MTWGYNPCHNVPLSVSVPLIVIMCEADRSGGSGLANIAPHPSPGGLVLQDAGVGGGQGGWMVDLVLVQRHV